MDTAQVVSRFQAERQALMDHPAIATVFDGGSSRMAGSCVALGERFLLTGLVVAVPEAFGR
jgi:hypothetical protein